ncbi:MAG: hypothetical protein CR217_09865, partial [Beijerinckiaceae bacterium]
IEKRSRSCASPQSASCSEDFVIPHEVTGQTLRGHIDAFIEAYNENAKAFAWTKSKVHQKRLKARFADNDSGY